MRTRRPSLIGTAQAATLSKLFRERVAGTPEGQAYRQYDRVTATWRTFSWREVDALVASWRTALAGEALASGDRVALWLRNSVEWVCMEQAALGLGLVPVPLYTTDNPENIAYVLGDSGARLLLVDSARRWAELEAYRASFPQLGRLLCLENAPLDAFQRAGSATTVQEWLSATAGQLTVAAVDTDPDGIATLVYTSGTTGRPKGVMLSHRNILWNVEAVLRLVPAYPDDVFLSFLPLSHAFERTCGYYLPMSAGSCVAYARSLQQLPEDLLAVRPTVLISVPRIYERLYARLQQQLAEKGGVARKLFDQAAQIGWRRFCAAQGRAAAPPWSDRLLWPVLEHTVADRLLARLGGRLRVTVSGGAPLGSRIAECLIGLGLPLLQGYGLTEAAPVVSANLLEDNVPASVGVPLPGAEVKIGPQDELLVRSPGVMLGYWNRPADTRQAIDADGWLHTGDQARISAGHIYVVGRLKEILVMSTGEKVAPNDLEMATCMDPLFDQAMVVGEGMPYVGLLLVVNGEAWRKLAPELGVAADDPAALRAEAVTRLALARAQAAAHAFPRYAQPRAVWLTLEPWTIENGLITPTMKLKRSVLAQRFASAIRTLYARSDLGQPGAPVA